MYLYRYKIIYGETPSETRLKLFKFTVLKITPKGYWISIIRGYKYRQWVNNYTKKRFAFPAIEEALENLISRTRTYKSILEYKIDCINIALRKAKNKQ